MNVLGLQIFVSLSLVTGSIILFAFACRQRDFEQSERLSLLPIEDETPNSVRALSNVKKGETKKHGS